MDKNIFIKHLRRRNKLFHPAKLSSLSDDEIFDAYRICVKCGNELLSLEDCERVVAKLGNPHHVFKLIDRLQEVHCSWNKKKGKRHQKKSDLMNRLTNRKCEFIDPETGIVCGRNVPMKKNARFALLENILIPLSIEDELKEQLRYFVHPESKNYEKPSRSIGKSMDELQTRNVGEDICRQIKTVINGKLEGRAEFCTEHIVERCKE